MTDIQWNEKYPSPDPAKLVPIIDTYFRLVDPQGGEEPNPGSVVLIDGQFGQAWQRHFSDGLWYSCSPRRGGVEWSHFLASKNVMLAYDAPVRPR